jgi:RimJ/RimL family protein N-acetyltransferase
VELTTARLSLTPLDPDRDAEALHAAYSDQAVMHWWDAPASVDVAETREHLASRLRGEGALAWTVQEGTNAVGIVGLLGDVAVPGLSWMLCRQAWGRGLMTEAATAVVDHALGSLGMARVEAWVETTNVRSLATARRLGLTERGRLAQRYPHRERPHESIVLGRSREPERSAVLSVEVTLPVRDVGTEFELLRSALGARSLYEAGDPVTVVGVVFGAWSVGPGLRLVAASSPIAPVTVSVDVGTNLTRRTVVRLQRERISSLRPLNTLGA